VPPQSSDENVPPDATATQPTERDQPQRDALLDVLLAVAGWTGLGLAILAVLLAPFLAVVVVKARRRSRRRRRGSARARAVHGWSELQDAAVDAGAVAPTSTSTRVETADLLGGEGLRAVAVLVDRAQFAPAEPTPADLDRIWGDVERERLRLLRAHGRPARLRAAVSLRSLRTYHGKGGRRSSE
jgi:hypothetical protein